MTRAAFLMLIISASAVAQTEAPAPIDPDATRYREQGAVTFAEPPERLVSEVDPIRLLDDLRLVYRRSPLAERLVVSLLSPEGARTETIDLFFLEDRAALVMGPLTVEASGQGEGEIVILAEHQRDAQRIVRATLDAATTPAALRLFLPATPVPQLDLALQPPSDSDAMAEPKPDRITAWAPAVAWERGLLLPDEAPPAAAVVGTGANDASVELLMESESMRLLRAVIDRPSIARRLDIEIAPLDPAAAPAPLRSTGRQVVPALADLQPTPPERPLPDRLDLLVFDMDARPVRLPADVDATLAVAIFRQPEGADMARRLVAGAELAATDLEEPLAIRRVAILEREDRPDLDLLAETLGKDILWSPDATRALDAIEPDADALLLIYGKGGVLRLALTWRDAKDAEDMAERIVKTLAPGD